MYVCVVLCITCIFFFNLFVYVHVPKVQYIVSVNDALPLGTAISGAVEVRRPIVAAVVVGHYIDLIGVVRRNPHLRNPTAFWQTLQAAPRFDCFLDFA